MRTFRPGQVRSQGSGRSWSDQLGWHDLRDIHGGPLVQAALGLSVTPERLGHPCIAVSSDFCSGDADALQGEIADPVGQVWGG